MISFILKCIVKFVFPSKCVICDNILPFGFKLQNEYLCMDCRDKISFIKEPTCKKCGAMINDKNDMLCVRCKDKLYDSFEFGFGLCRYNDAVKESLHKIKYSGKKDYINFYGKCIAKVFYKRIKNLNIDCLIPVPIHRVRLRIRNYNQSTILARAISKELKEYGIDIEVNENLIFRKKNTKVLNKLNNDSRVLELKNAFYTVSCGNIKNVMIVDDIYTTGATIDGIAKCLKNAGVENIYFVAIAIVDNL